MYRKPTMDDWKRERQLAALPRTASIGTGGFVIAHLGMYPRATIAMSDQDFLVFDAFSDPAFWHAYDSQKVAQLVKSGSYRIVLQQTGIVVLARK